VSRTATRIDRLSLDDEIMLAASARWPQDIVAVALLDGRPLLGSDGFAIDRVRAAIAGRIHLAPRLRQRLVQPSRWLGPPYWADDPAFDIRAHVSHLPLEPPVDERGMLLVVEELRRQALDRARPLWQMWFLTGLPDGQVAWVLKLHHAMADGLAAMTTIRSLLDAPGDDDGPAPAWRPQSTPTMRRLLVDATLRRVRSVAAVALALARPWRLWRQLLAAWPALRELVGERPASRTSVDALIGEDRALAVLRIPSTTVRHIARAHDASANDVLLAAVGAGLRALLRTRGERTDGRLLRVYVPVTLRRRLGGAQHGNRVSQMVVPLALDGGHPGDRLRRIAAETERRKARMRVPLGAVFGSRLARMVILKAVIRQRVNITTASIPGGSRRRSLAGAPLLEVIPVLPLIGNVPLGIGAVAHSGTVGIGITADRATFPDLDVLVAGMRAELEALEATVGGPSRELVDRRSFWRP